MRRIEMKSKRPLENPSRANHENRVYEARRRKKPRHGIGHPLPVFRETDVYDIAGPGNHRLL